MYCCATLSELLNSWMLKQAAWSTELLSLHTVSEHVTHHGNGSSGGKREVQPLKIYVGIDIKPNLTSFRLPRFLLTVNNNSWAVQITNDADGFQLLVIILNSNHWTRTASSSVLSLSINNNYGDNNLVRIPCCWAFTKCVGVEPLIKPVSKNNIRKN